MGEEHAEVGGGEDERQLAAGLAACTGIDDAAAREVVVLDDLVHGGVGRTDEVVPDTIADHQFGGGTERFLAQIHLFVFDDRVMHPDLPRHIVDGSHRHLVVQADRHLALGEENLCLHLDNSFLFLGVLVVEDRVEQRGRGVEESTLGGFGRVGVETEAKPAVVGGELASQVGDGSEGRVLSQGEEKGGGEGRGLRAEGRGLRVEDI